MPKWGDPRSRRDKVEEPRSAVFSQFLTQHVLILPILLSSSCFLYSRCSLISIYCCSASNIIYRKLIFIIFSVDNTCSCSILKYSIFMSQKLDFQMRRASLIVLNIYLYQKRCWSDCKWKWNESGFRPPLCTYRLNWARRTSWGWWDDWNDTVLQTQDLKFEPWRSEAEHATSRSRRLPTILTFTRGWGRNNFVLFQTAETGNRTPDSGVKGSGANHYPRAPARSDCKRLNVVEML